VERIGDDDSHPFLDAKMPVIAIHSITQDTFPILHTPADKQKAIHAEEYYDAYRLSANYLALLDQTVIDLVTMVDRPPLRAPPAAPEPS
jgi:hypothetical protein